MSSLWFYLFSYSPLTTYASRVTTASLSISNFRSSGTAVISLVLLFTFNWPKLNCCSVAQALIRCKPFFPKQRKPRKVFPSIAMTSQVILFLLLESNLKKLVEIELGLNLQIHEQSYYEREFHSVVLEMSLTRLLFLDHTLRYHSIVKHHS